MGNQPQGGGGGMFDYSQVPPQMDRQAGVPPLQETTQSAARTNNRHRTVSDDRGGLTRQTNSTGGGRGGRGSGSNSRRATRRPREETEETDEGRRTRRRTAPAGEAEESRGEQGAPFVVTVANVQEFGDGPFGQMAPLVTELQTLNTNLARLVDELEAQNDANAERHGDPAVNIENQEDLDDPDREDSQGSHDDDDNQGPVERV